jgi:hypothetical protein
VGPQQRYGDADQRRRFNRKAEAHALIPQSLSETERGSEPVTRGASVPVKAWVDYGDASAQVLSSAVAWTGRCVLVLWAGAVERVES